MGSNAMILRWQKLFSEFLNPVTVKEMDCFDEAWSDWLDTGNPYAVRDRDMMKTDGGKYMNLIAITGTASK